jgi:hypothetical protein
MKHYFNHSAILLRFFLRPLLLLGLGWLPFGAMAQDCDLACNGTQDFPVQVVLNQSCQIAISTNVLVQDLASCPGVKRLTVRDSLNNLIADNFDLVQFSGSNYVGSRLSVTITDQATGTICVSIIRVVDNLPPTIGACPELTVSCLDNTSPEVLGSPSVADNCDADLTLTSVENFELRNCLSDTAGIILRVWTVRDDRGLTATCTQQINIMRASFMDVAFPDDITLPCNDPGADPLRTGIPQLNGTTLMHGDFCGLTVSYSDDTTFLCNAYMYRIDRTWTVVENCTDFFGEDTQLILVSDNQGPTLNCPTPAQLVFNSDPGACSATIALPAITATDNCSSAITYAVSSSYGATNFNAVSGVAPGIHTVQYVATDECGTSNSCTVQLTVVDDLAPIAACDDQLLVSIASGGYAIMGAAAFNEGSSDNCNAVFLKARRNDPAACDLANGDDSPQQAGYQEWFDDRVFFCCADVPNGPVTVTLRVYEVNPGTGPVDPARETGSGNLVGRYTDCQSIVTLQDGARPSFTSCPGPRTIQCTDEQENLTLYGSPIATDNCGFTIDSTFTTSFNECHQGTIIRTWTATDLYGQTASCSQTITVVNNQVLQESDIIWPDNITFYECGHGTDFADLPLANRAPVINNPTCGTLGINHTDATFNTVPGACFKVIRTWTVIDWCHYNTENPDGPGRYVHNQIIKVLDNTPPTITCPAPVTVNVGPDCAHGAATLGLPTSADCSNHITFTNDSPYATSGGANASGTYPVGTTTVRFLANDGCSNNTACTTTVTVADTKAPNIACILGLTVTLMNNGAGDVSMSLDAGALVASSSDNCTPTPLIKYTINRPGDGTMGVPTATQVTFDCYDAGTAAEVYVWATDEQHNSASCHTVVSVQNHNGNCTGQTGEGLIAGGVLTESGQEVENVMIMVSGEAPNPNIRYTDVDGSFQFEALSLGTDYSVSATNNEELLNGVSTFDLILMGKHVLGTRLLDSPYKIIAADIDRSGHISTLDIIKLRKLILRIDEQLPNGNTSWRFVDASYVFPDPQNPFLGYFPEIYNVNNLAGPEMHADFVGIKVGDVNGTAIPNSLMSTGGDRASDYSLDITVANATVAAGDLVDITFSAEYMNEWMGYQFTLEFDPAALEFKEIIPGDLPNLYAEENFHLHDLERGLITTVWNEYGESASSKPATLFTLRCTARQAGDIKNWVYLSSRVTRAEAYTADGTPESVRLIFAQQNTEVTTSFELFQNRPNPWTNSTIIPFQLEEDNDARLSVYDMAGKLVYQVGNRFSAGYHEISISRDDLPAIGLFYYTLEAGGQRSTRKMVLAD